MTEIATAPLIFYDRSRREKDDKCRRARYWSTEWRGRGIEPARKAYELEYGTVGHRGFAALAHGEGVDSVVEIETAALRQIIMTERGGAWRGEDDERYLLEQQTLVEAHLRGVALCILPAILAEDDILAIEREMVYDYEGLRLGTKPDLVTQRRSDGRVRYREYKTTKYVNQKWFDQWPRAVQLMAGTKSVEQTLGVACDQAIVHALYKGYTYKDQLTCPLVYGWRRMGMGGYEYAGSRPQSWKGWERFPVWEHEGGVKAWVERDLPREELAACFPQTPPIMMQEHLVEAWLRQSAIREREIAGARGRNGATLDAVFPQNFAACQPAYGGRECEFLHACWLPQVERDPLASGHFRLRQPHHLTDPVLLHDDDD